MSKIGEALDLLGDLGNLINVEWKSARAKRDIDRNRRQLEKMSGYAATSGQKAIYHRNDDEIRGLDLAKENLYAKGIDGFVDQLD